MEKRTLVLLLALACAVSMVAVQNTITQETVPETTEPSADTSGSADQPEPGESAVADEKKPTEVVAETGPSAGAPEGAKAEENDVFELMAPSEGGQPVQAEAEGPQPATTGLISVSFDEVPVPDVVDMFSRISGANIIIAGAFTNQFVTANLKNVEWRAALNLVLGSVGLSMIEDPSGIIMVVTSEMYQQKLKQIEETKPLVTRVFKPQYMNPVDLVLQIKQMNVLSPRGTIITSQSKEQDLASLKSAEETARPFSSTEKRQNPSITTAVVVTDIKEYVDKVAALIKQLDKREPQVFIEARIIDVISSEGMKLGFDWEMLDSFGVSAGLQDLKWTFSDSHQVDNTKENKDSLYDKRSNTDQINQRYDIDGTEYQEETTTYEESPPDSGNWVANTVITPTRSIDDKIETGRDITSDYTDTVKDTLAQARTATALLNVSEVSLIMSALKKTGNAKMLSHPLLIVGNRVEAKIHVGEVTWQITLKKNVTNVGAAPETEYSEEAKTIQLGLKLWVIPEINIASDIVRLTVNPEMTIFVEDIVTAQGSVYPVTSTRTITTRVNVPSGETLVIGGLIEYTKSKIEKKVPFLGDIPLLGLLFKHTQDSVEKHNLIILLTPTILDDEAPATGYEAMGWQTAEELEMVPLSPSKAIAGKPVLPGTEAAEQTNSVSEASSAELKTEGTEGAPTADLPESSEP